MNEELVSNDNSSDFDLAEALLLKFSNGLSYEKLSKHYNVPNSTIYSRFKAFIGALDNKEFNNNFDALETKLCRLGKLKHLINLSSDEVVKSSSANNSAYVVGQLNTVQALAEGKPTSILNIEQIDKEILELKVKVEMQIKKELSMVNRVKEE